MLKLEYNMNPKEYYDEKGYFIAENLIPEQQIDALLNAFERDIKLSKYPFYRQNTNVYEANELSEHGFVKQSFLDIHDYKKFKEFSNAAKELFCSKIMQDALEEVTGYKNHNLMQSMLFDQNTETCPHQDKWYLDTVPPGNLLGAWIALEDIHEEAGRFFLIPCSKTVDLHEDGMPHKVWLEKMQAYFDENIDQVIAPALKKGDVIFWNSATIHGSLETKNEKYSRKSLTAHYIPEEMSFGNMFVEKEYIKYNEYKNVKYYKNQADFSLVSNLMSKIKVAAYSSPNTLKLLRKVQKIAKI